jgi:hypothetical protein
MRTIAVKAHGLLLDFWEVVKSAFFGALYVIHSATDQAFAMFSITLGLAVLYVITGSAALLGVALLFSYRWGQLTMQDDARIICDECQRELEVQ